MQGDVLSSAHPHAQLEPLEAIPSPDPLPVDRPTFAAEQHPDSQVPEPRPGMGQIPNAQSQGRLVFGPTLPIPGCPPKLGQPTGPRTTHRERPVKPLGQFPATGGPQTFFRRASESMCLSSERSATSRFNRRFSSSS